MKNSLQEVVGKLEGLFDKFNEVYYENKLQRPVIAVHPDSTGHALGWCTTYEAWKTLTGEGHYEINVCAEYLARTIQEVCGTLLHEMVHLHCLQNDIKDTSRGTSYHNKKFKEVAESHGLIIEHDPRYGWTKTSLNANTESLIESLGESAFELYRSKIDKVSKGTKKSSSRKYICPCCGISVRATKEVSIVCRNCDEVMETE